MKFVHLTDLRGRTVALAPDKIVALRPLVEGESPSGGEIKVICENSDFTVRETLAEIEAKLKD